VSTPGFDGTVLVKSSTVLAVIETHGRSLSLPFNAEKRYKKEYMQ